MAHDTLRWYTRPVRRSPFLATLVVVDLALIGAGFAARWAGRPGLADVAWAVVAGAALLGLLWTVVASLRRRELGVDVVALLALAGALALGQFLAGAVIGLMLVTGRALEDYAAGRAERELSALIQRAPREAHRYQDGALAVVPAEDVRAGDRLLVRPGDVLPVDGVVATGAALLDESALTGESRPVERAAAERVASGTVNAGPAFDLLATAPAAESTYAGIVRLVAEARRSRSPFTRLADRYALIFVPLTLALAGGAWLASGSALRALAVLVVATPCPLLLATPIAIVAGISRAARRGILIKTGSALEALGGARTLLFDKTGTLTLGSAHLTRIAVLAPGVEADEVLRLAASLDQVSSHVFAAAILRAAHERGLALAFPTGAAEHAGDGIEGTIDGARVAVGKLDWVTRAGAAGADAIAVRTDAPSTRPRSISANDFAPRKASIGAPGFMYSRRTRCESRDLRTR